MTSMATFFVVVAHPRMMLLRRLINAPKVLRDAAERLSLCQGIPFRYNPAAQVLRNIKVDIFELLRDM
jgi:hypothetical protein